jgi:rSAM/selenodomain-associated transferase 2/rSAM/selenodomain-associated transferase 1
MKRNLRIFTRYPEPHRTKTRLIPLLGPNAAAELQGDMTDHTLAWARELAGKASVSVQVRFEGGDEARMRDRFGDSFPYLPQGPGDLGDRMTRAIEEAFAAGADRVIVAGTDCPDLTSALAEEAFERLATADLVLGPATDGGYYLVGLRQPRPLLFHNISWGQETVLRETLQRAQDFGLSTSLLPALSDVDRPEDVPVWHRAKGPSQPNSRPSLISIVIPTLNEAPYLDRALAPLRDIQNIETIVVDGGSGDGTDVLAAEHGAKLVRSSPGRGHQMNAGARAAAGEILLFLHADTQLPNRFDEHVRRALDQPNVLAGAFRLRLDGSQLAFRFIEWAVNLRSRYLQMPYGDQALFLRADSFRRMGGFPELPIMEDFEFIRRLRRHGRIAIVPVSASTSARRWKRFGPWKTTWINQQVILGYCLGVSPETLSRWYSHVGSHSES